MGDKREGKKAGENEQQNTKKWNNHQHPTKISLTLTLSAADLSTETSLDGRDGTTRSARVAGDEVQTVLSLVEFCVGAAAGLASDVFDCLR